jgi:hypothetical protein
MNPWRQAPLDETASYAVAALLLALGVLSALPLGLAVPLGLLAAAQGLGLTVRRLRTLARQRESADAVLETLPGERVPEGLGWRAEELGSPGRRRAIARQLHRFARMGRERILITPVPVFLETLRPNIDELEEIAEVVEETERPLPPRSLVLLEALLGNADESPLYRPGSPDELGEALHDLHDALERRAA